MNENKNKAKEQLVTSKLIYAQKIAPITEFDMLKYINFFGSITFVKN